MPAKDSAVTVLLVDDNLSLCDAFSLLLETEGYRVDVATSLAEAARKVASSPGAYAIAIIDLQLGDGRGTDLLPLLRATSPKTKIVILSGTTEVVAGAGAVALGADASFPKGSPIDSLLDLIAGLLRKGAR